MKPLDLLATILVIVGGLNWGMVAVANLDLVALVTGAGEFGSKNMLGTIIYALVGVSAIYLALTMGRMRRADV
jgi:hypothetical protein